MPGPINPIALPADSLEVTGGVPQDFLFSSAIAPDVRAHSMVWNPGTNNMELLRTPSIYKTLLAAATSNAIWTPAAGKKFRLMGFSIVLSADATLAVAGETVLSLVDNATNINIAFAFWVPSVALTTSLGTTNPVNFNLPGNGYLSLAANNVLNANLTVALATGKFSINAMGTEE